MDKWDYCLAIFEPALEGKPGSLVFLGTQGAGPAVDQAQASVMTALKWLSDGGWEVIAYQVMMNNRCHILGKKPFGQS